TGRNRETEASRDYGNSKRRSRPKHAESIARVRSRSDTRRRLRLRSMRIRLNTQHDRATIYVSDERASYEHVGTYLVLTDPVEVQLGFEGEHRLLFVIVCPASKMLSSELLEQAERY